MDQVIVAMSGRKCAGKNTLGSWICRWWSLRQFEVGLAEDIHPVLARAAREFPENLADYVDKFRQDITLECSFADNLKNFIVDTLGLRREQCYGDDHEKTTPTEYQWEDASPFLAWKFGSRDIVEEWDNDFRLLVGNYRDEANPEKLRRLFYNPADNVRQSSPRKLLKPIGSRTGPMTGRDIMQIVGTDLIRETFGNVWAKATIRHIKKQGKYLSVITDNRFPNEIAAVLAEPKGYVIRLTRSPFGNHDIHPSEAALDDFDWRREKCFVLNNAEMTIDEQNEAIIPILKQILEN